MHHPTPVRTLAARALRAAAARFVGARAAAPAA